MEIRRRRQATPFQGAPNRAESGQRIRTVVKIPWIVLLESEALEKSHGDICLLVDELYSMHANVEAMVEAARLMFNG